MSRITLCAALYALILIVSAVPAAAEPLELTLGELIGIGLDHNPQIEIARQQYMGREGVVTQAKSGYWPHLGTGGTLGRAYVGDLQPVDQDNLASGRLKLTQLIYDFGRTTGYISASGFSRDAAMEYFHETAQDIVFLIKQSFYSVLEKQRLISVAEQAVTNYEQQLYRAQRYYEAGVRTKIDITNAEVNLANQRLGLLRAKSNLMIARTDLENVLGINPNNGDYQLVSDEPPLAQLARTKPELPGQLQDLLQMAGDKRPGLARYRLLVDAAEASLKQVKGEYWPVFNASGEYQNYETDLTTLADQWQVGVGLTWEFFSGFETDGKVAEASARLAEIEASLKNFEQAVAREVTNSYLRAEENRDGVDIADQSLALAKENLALAEGRYKAGIGDILEFNDAQLLFTENNATLVITYYSYLTAIAEIERAVGMTPELIGYDPLGQRD